MKKFITLFSLFAFNAFAQSPSQDSIIIKLSDVVPNKDEVAQTTSCKYNLTIYNRTDKDLSNTVFTLKWIDEAAIKAIEAEKKASQKSKNVLARGYSKTKDLERTTLTSEVTINAIPSKKQIKITQEVVTDKCFLLLEPAEVSVKTCRFVSEDAANNKKTSSKADTNCKSSFVLVDASSPEYYTEFSDENYDAKKAKQKSLIEKDLADIDELYNQNIKSVEELNKVLESM